MRVRSFTVVVIALIGATSVSACAGDGSSPISYVPPSGAASATPSSAPVPGPASASATPASSSPSSSASSSAKASAGPKNPAKPSRAKGVVSDLSRLERAGIDLDEGVLIDVADDGQDRYLQIGKNGVDFTGTSKTDSTMMSLKAAPVRERNRVVIKPPFYNEDLGDGYCVADTAGSALKLETCKAGRTAQIWEVRPAGDSGQFELHGIHGVVRVNNGKITTSGSGRTGLQTIPFA